MSTLPTSAPFRFATSLASRVAISAARKISGYLGGDPVPDGEHNELFGVNSDWVFWLADRFERTDSSAVEKLPLGNSHWTFDDIPGDPSSVSRTTSETPYLTRVALERPAVAHSAEADAYTMIRSEGGYLKGLTVSGHDAGTDSELWIRVMDINGFTKAQFSGLLPASYGSITMAAVGPLASSNGPCFIEINIKSLTISGSSAQTATIGDLVLNWGPVP